MGNKREGPFVRFGSKADMCSATMGRLAAANAQVAMVVKNHGRLGQATPANPMIISGVYWTGLC